MVFDRWEHQWLRAWRWHKRCLAASGRTGDTASLDAEDFAEALAQSVWHLKDWLINDQRQGIPPKKEIEDFATNHPTLKVLADLCNGSKHARLTAPRVPGTEFQATAWEGEGDIDDPASVRRVWIMVDSPEWSEPRELIDVAHEGLDAWAQWLTSKGLTLPGG